MIFSINVDLTSYSLKLCYRTSLVAQWLRIHLPMQGTRVQALVWEDPTCHGATKPTCHNYWACALEPVSHSYWARVPQLLKPARSEAHVLQLLSPGAATTEARAPGARAEATAMRSPRTTTKSSPRSPQLEKARVQQWRPNAAKIYIYIVNGGLKIITKMNFLKLCHLSNPTLPHLKLPWVPTCGFNKMLLLMAASLIDLSLLKWSPWDDPNENTPQNLPSPAE